MSERSILFFDGDCGLCCGFVRFMHKRDVKGRLAYAPIGGETWDARIGSCKEEDRNTIHLLTNTGAYKRSSAVVRALDELGGAWSIVAWILWVIPLPLRNIGYRIVAGVRYRLFGKAKSCPIDEKKDPSCLLP